MLVFAFDRDWTVDVNPHPRHDAVPLEWVHYLAHDTDHVVYAIGNQDLTDEAAIPGIVDIVGRHPDHWDEWLGQKQPDGYYERFPTRRERLALIADLHPDADDYIVVDDLDLGDVDGWQHYHAWEFVPVVERGEIDPSLPWTSDPVTDGGLPASAGIVPTDAAHLESFLEEHADSPGFELTYADGDEESTRLCWTVSMQPAAPDEESRPATIECTALTPTDDSVAVPVDAVRMLHAVDIPPEAVTNRAETPAETAAALQRYTDAYPERVRVSSILALLDRESVPAPQQRDAVRALQSVAAVRPEDCTPAIPILRSLLAEPSCPAAADALSALRRIGEHSPADIAPAVDQFVSLLESDRSSVRREAAGCLAAISVDAPEDVVEAVPELQALLADDVDGQRYAVRALERVAAESPSAVAPAAGLLAETMVDQSSSETTRLSATAALGRVTSEDPSLATAYIDEVVRLYDAEAYKLRNNAIALTYEIVAVHTDLIEPHVDEIAALLDVEDAYTRTNASGTLARVAADFPAALDHLTSRFVDLLSDEDHRVRENAAWLLGRLQVADATATLEDRLDSEPNERVRNRIAWALSEIQPL